MQLHLTRCSAAFLPRRGGVARRAAADLALSFALRAIRTAGVAVSFSGGRALPIAPVLPHPERFPQHPRRPLVLVVAFPTTRAPPFAPTPSDAAQTGHVDGRGILDRPGGLHAGAAPLEGNAQRPPEGRPGTHAGHARPGAARHPPRAVLVRGRPGALDGADEDGDRAWGRGGGGEGEGGGRGWGSGSGKRVGRTQRRSG